MTGIRSHATALLSLSVILLADVAPAGAQKTTDEPMASNAIYVEALGNALIYSFNYERRLDDGFAARIGFMYMGFSGEDIETGEHAEIDLAVIPIMANWLLGDGAGRLELGIGPLFAFGAAEIEDIEGETGEVDAFGPAGVTSTIGYRYHPEEGGIVFRVGVTPFWSGDPGIWGGISLGWAY